MSDRGMIMETDNRFLPPQDPKWNLWDAFIVLVSLLLLIPVAKFAKPVIIGAIELLRVTGNNPETLSLFIGALAQGSTMILAVSLLVWLRGGNGRELGFNWETLVRNVLTGFAGGVLLGLIVWVLSVVMVFVFGPPPPQDIEQFLAGLVSGKDLLLPFIAVSVLAPLSEEIYFRGMVYPVVRRRFGPIVGMVLSGLFFGAMHLDLYRLVPIAAMGFALAYFYERTGSIVTSIIAHSTWNTFMLVMLYAAGNISNTR